MTSPTPPTPPTPGSPGSPDDTLGGMFDRGVEPGPISGLLDALGEAERGSMPAGLVDRSWTASLASLHGVVETSARAAELGGMDRAAGGPGLEDRVEAATRESLLAPTLRLVGHEGSRRVVARRGMSWRFGLAAAAVLALGAGAAVMLSGNTAGVPGNLVGTGGLVEVASTASIEAQLDTKMDTLLLAMQDVPAGAELDSIGEFKPEWLDELTTAPAQRNGL